MQDAVKHIEIHKAQTIRRIKESEELRSLLELAYNAAAADGIHVWNCEGKCDDKTN
jgi:hypothetical protein